MARPPTAGRALIWSGIAVAALLCLWITSCARRPQRTAHPPASRANAPRASATPQSKSAWRAHLHPKVAGLLARMTLAEKVGQLVQFGKLEGAYAGKREAMIARGQIGSLLNIHGASATNALQKIALTRSRLKVPLLFANDVIHGYHTTFPIPLAEASSFDPALVERAERVAAIEASAAGTHWIFAPMVDIARDPRWGRIAEGSGEDPYLGAKLAAARVRGFQGARLDAPDTVLACAKHFVGYGAVLAGREYANVDLPWRALREIYLPPFRAAVRAGVTTLMVAFNDVNGVPMAVHRRLLGGVLRREWGFDGVVISDWRSVKELIDHRVAADDAEAARAALLAGVDIDMQGGVYHEKLASEVEAGRVPIEAVDRAVARVLELKRRLGLFRRPLVDPAREAELARAAAHRKSALELARESIVLLKNDRGVLPLSRTVRRVALIGPLAADQREPLGPWSSIGKADHVISVARGVRDLLGDRARVEVVAGCDAVTCAALPGLSRARRAARRADAVIAVVGEPAAMSGEAASRTSLRLPGRQRELLQALAKTGKPLVVVLMNGRPLVIPWVAEHAAAIVEGWFLGAPAGRALAEVLFGVVNPSGKLPISFPRHEGQIPIYRAQRPSGRPFRAEDKYTTKYIDRPNAPQWPFGFGLSYTRFRYDELSVKPRRAAKKTPVHVSVKLTNVGERAGTEIVMLYLRDDVASVSRPPRMLRGFSRVSLQPGQSRRITFTLGADELSLFDAQLERRLEPGSFTVFVGPHHAKFELSAAR